MNKILLVARNEFIKHIKKPAFWFTLALMPVLMTINMLANSSSNDSSQGIPGLAIAGQLEMTKDPAKMRLGIVDQSGLITSIPESFPAATKDLYVLYPDEAQARVAVEQEAVSAFYIIPADYLETGSVIRYSEQLNPFGDAIQSQLLTLLLNTSLLDDRDVLTARALMDPSAVMNVSALDVGAAQSTASLEKRQQTAFMVGYVFTMLLFISIFVAASWLLQALIEEKENRVIEVVLSSITTRQLLVGKVLGLGLLGLFEIVVWIGFGIIALKGNFVSLPEMELSWTLVVLALCCFILGYLIYSSLMAGIGAIANTMREGSQLTVVVVIPIMIPIFLMSVIVTQPTGMLSQALSFFPLTAPIVLVVRAAISTLPFWQLAISMVLMVLTVVGLQSLAARLFRANNLLTGNRISFKNFWNAFRSS